MVLQERPEFQIIGEASDGLDAVRKSAELQPDLILLDIGLPELNGIEAARRICESAPGSTILFVSENQCPTVVREALRIGACARGYVVKSSAADELLPALEAVIKDKCFVSSRFVDIKFADFPDAQFYPLARGNRD